MTRMVLVLAVVVLPCLASAQELPRLIDQNIQSANAIALRLDDAADMRMPRLWIHVRNDAQRLEVLSRVAWFKGIRLSGRELDVRAIQMVATGPLQSQLRFFKAADNAQARELLVEVRKAVPAVVLQDLSSRYRQANWIEPGHFELWLAPVTRLAAP